jgi:small-conductance mechanosensitive channel
MTPAAYHRLVEKGENTEHFHRFASRMLIASMVPLALGLCAGFYVVTLKVTGSQTAAVLSAAIMLLFFYGLWFGFTLYVRRQYERRAQRRNALRNEEKQLAV